MKKLSILLALLVVLSCAGCRSEEDRLYDQLVNHSSALPEAESQPAGQPEKTGAPQVNTELSGQLVLRTYTSPATAEIWQDYIREFNELYPDVEIRMADVDAISDVSEYISRTTVELMSGEAGDILDLSFLPATRYSASGVLRELDDLMDAYPDFTGDKYYTNVLDAMRCQGKLYCMPYEFALVGIRLDRAATDALEFSCNSGDSIGVSQVLELAARANQLPDFADMPVLGYCQWDAFNFVEFSSRIDEDERKADFESESFVEYLTALKALRYKEDAGPGASLMPDDGFLSDGFCTIAGLRTASKQFGENYATLLDSPTVTPMLALQPDSGEGLFSAMSLGITSSCKNPEAAFTFIKFVMDNERRLDPDNYLRSDFTPVNREVHRKTLEVYLPDEPEQAAAIDRWCSEVQTVIFYDRNRELLDQLNEICQQYMNDLLSPEECARQMQERAYLYLNE